MYPINVKTAELIVLTCFAMAGFMASKSFKKNWLPKKKKFTFIKFTMKTNLQKIIKLLFLNVQKIEVCYR